jgi:hypothetical protein
MCCECARPVQPFGARVFPFGGWKVVHNENVPGLEFGHEHLGDIDAESLAIRRSIDI